MVPEPQTESKVAVRRRLTDEMLRLGQQIDKHEPCSPERLELLRQQATLGDEREAVHSTRR
jgi:hypothetical protein